MTVEEKLKSYLPKKLEASTDENGRDIVIAEYHDSEVDELRNAFVGYLLPRVKFANEDTIDIDSILHLFKNECCDVLKSYINSVKVLNDFYKCSILDYTFNPDDQDKVHLYSSGEHKLVSEIEIPKEYLELNIDGFGGGQTSYIECEEIFEDVLNQSRSHRIANKPKNILEIGFNSGHSATTWLLKSDANLTSVDICSHENVEKCAEIVSSNFGSRFNFIKYDSTKLDSKIIDGKFDLIYIDGAHTYEACLADIETGLRLNCDYFFIDDYWDCFDPRHVSMGVKRSIDENSDALEIQKVYRNREIHFQGMPIPMAFLERRGQ
jgi:hypothetical protein